MVSAAVKPEKGEKASIPRKSPMEKVICEKKTKKQYFVISSNIGKIELILT